MKWLLNHRTDFSDNGWAQLCGGENMKYGVMGKQRSGTRLAVFFTNSHFRWQSLQHDEGPPRS